MKQVKELTAANYPNTIKSLKKIVNKESLPKYPLTIPTYDDDARVTHPDVVYVPDGWNGYKYWMAFTPYPDLNRENPSIVASNDGINWEEPSGISNPIVPLSEMEADGYYGGSDTDMILYNNILYMYYRPYGVTAGGDRKEAICLKTSTDGVNWSERQIVVTSESTGEGIVSKIMSPAVVVIDETFYMFTVDADGIISRRQSADGITWSNLTEVTASSAYYYHLDACVTDDGRIHFLVHCFSTKAILAYQWSDDNGETILGSLINAVPQTCILDNDLRYRSTFQPVHGYPRKFHVWVTQRTEDTEENPIHKIIAFLPNLELGDYSLGRRELIKYLGATQLYPKDTEIVSEVISSRHYVHTFPAAGNYALLGSLYIPNWWPDLFYQIIFMNTDETQIGNVTFEVNFMFQNFDKITAPDLKLSEIRHTVTKASGGYLKIQNIGGRLQDFYAYDNVDVWNNISRDDLGFTALRFGRKGNDANDTHPGNISVLGIMFSYKPFINTGSITKMSEIPG